MILTIDIAEDNAKSLPSIKQSDVEAYALSSFNSFNTIFPKNNLTSHDKSMFNNIVHMIGKELHQELELVSWVMLGDNE